MKRPPKTPRNALCPCASGKKYKKCCLITEAHNRQQEKLAFLQQLQQDRKARRLQPGGLAVSAFLAMAMTLSNNNKRALKLPL